MEENIEKENPDSREKSSKPENAPGVNPHNLPDQVNVSETATAPELNPAKEAETISENQEVGNMEVHHHSHSHGKRNWKSYIWEFLMLFLAVFCGFLAEYKLEHVIEHNREKTFIESMIEDAQLDTAHIRKIVGQKEIQRLYADSLIKALYNYEPGKVSDFVIYRYFRQIIGATDWVKPTERTLMQLKNSGGMRLIRNKNAADIIIAYDGSGNEVIEQQDFLEKVFLEIWQPSCQLFNFNYYNPGTYRGISEAAVLQSHDKQRFVQFANMLTAYGGGLSIYCQELRKMQDQAIKLMDVLKHEYHL